MTAVVSNRARAVKPLGGANPGENAAGPARDSAEEHGKEHPAREGQKGYQNVGGDKDSGAPICQRLD
jgi:hypothetical protein